MIFQAHCREGRDIFVTNDEKDFIRGGKRDELQALGSTRILRSRSSASGSRSAS
jgi:hypothetical protein